MALLSVIRGWYFLYGIMGEKYSVECNPPLFFTQQLFAENHAAYSNRLDGTPPITLLGISAHYHLDERTDT